MARRRKSTKIQNHALKTMGATESATQGVCSAHEQTTASSNTAANESLQRIQHIYMLIAALETQEEAQTDIQTRVLSAFCTHWRSINDLTGAVSTWKSIEEILPVEQARLRLVGYMNEATTGECKQQLRHLAVEDGFWKLHWLESLGLFGLQGVKSRRLLIKLREFERKERAPDRAEAITALLEASARRRKGITKSKQGVSRLIEFSPVDVDEALIFLEKKKVKQRPQDMPAKKSLKAIGIQAQAGRGKERTVHLKCTKTNTPTTRDGDDTAVESEISDEDSQDPQDPQDLDDLNDPAGPAPHDSDNDDTGNNAFDDDDTGTGITGDEEAPNDTSDSAAGSRRHSRAIEPERGRAEAIGSSNDVTSSFTSFLSNADTQINDFPQISSPDDTNDPSLSSIKSPLRRTRITTSTTDFEITVPTLSATPTADLAAMKRSARTSPSASADMFAYKRRRISTAATTPLPPERVQKYIGALMPSDRSVLATLGSTADQLAAAVRAHDSKHNTLGQRSRLHRLCVLLPPSVHGCDQTSWSLLYFNLKDITIDLVIAAQQEEDLEKISDNLEELAASLAKELGVQTEEINAMGLASQMVYGCDSNLALIGLCAFLLRSKQGALPHGPLHPSWISALNAIDLHTPAERGDGNDENRAPDTVSNLLPDADDLMKDLACKAKEADETDMSFLMDATPAAFNLHTPCKNSMNAIKLMEEQVVAANSFLEQGEILYGLLHPTTGGEENEKRILDAISALENMLFVCSPSDTAFLATLQEKLDEKRAQLSEARSQPALEPIKARLGQIAMEASRTKSSYEKRAQELRSQLSGVARRIMAELRD